MINQTKKYAFFDFSYTISPHYFIAPFNQYISKKLLKEKYIQILEKNKLIVEREKMNLITYNEIVIEVINTLCDLLKGQKVESIKPFVKEFVKDFAIYPYIEPLFKYLYKEGFEINILTADFDFIIAPLLDKMPQGFKMFPSKLETIDGTFTGEIELIHNNNFKLETIQTIEASEKDIFTISFGDSEGDIPMLESSDLGFFINKDKTDYEKLIKKDTIIYIQNPDSVNASKKIIETIDKKLANIT
jgi:HAD superfamily phosphoserine phosphatase-like hydrolase